jgi:hypothetical protein
MTCIVVVQNDMKGARWFTRIAKLNEFAKNNGLHFKEGENGKPDRSVLFNKKEEETHTLFSFTHVNVTSRKRDPKNKGAYHEPKTPPTPKK